MSDPTDPAAHEINLELVLAQHPELPALTRVTIENARGELEALRERETARAGALTRMSNEVTELEAEVEAAEARVAELAGVMNDFVQWGTKANALNGDDFLNEGGWDDVEILLERARAALAAWLKRR